MSVLASTPKTEKGGERSRHSSISSVSSTSVSFDWSFLIEDSERANEDLERFKMKCMQKYGSKFDPARFEEETEGDSMILCRRQKQIDYGKNTPEYQHYIKKVPFSKRKKSVHPSTPSKYQKMSRRNFDQQTKIWRKRLHVWDPPKVEEKTRPRTRAYTKLRQQTREEESTLQGDRNIQPLLDVNSEESFPTLQGFTEKDTGLTNQIGMMDVRKSPRKTPVKRAAVDKENYGSAKRRLLAKSPKKTGKPKRR